MKNILIALAGAADHASEELAEKTPLEVAKIPNLNYFAKMGKVGQVKLTADRFEPSSDTSFLNLLGYDADKIYTGRGPLEAANLELSLEANEIAFRMNFITEADGHLADATSGGISTKEARALINYLNKKLSSDFVRFFGGTGYRHIVVIKDSHGYEALSAKTHAPEFLTGQKIEANLPKGPGEELLKKLMFDAKLLLQDHEINQVRVDLGENPANMIWLWGQGQRPDMEKFYDRYGVHGMVLADAEHAKGAARLSGLTVIETDGARTEGETDYEKIAKLLIQSLNEKDFVCLYLNDCEEASLKGDLKAKVSALEAADYFVLSKVREFIEEHKDARVLVTPGYALPWKTKKCTRDYVPFVTAGKNIMAGDIEKFSETVSRASTLKLSKSGELMKLFLAK